MAPRTGRPKTENPRTERVVIYLTKEDVEQAETAREKDKEPERTFASWLAKKVSGWIRKTNKK